MNGASPLNHEPNRASTILPRGDTYTPFESIDKRDPITTQGTDKPLAKAHTKTREAPTLTGPLSLHTEKALFTPTHLREAQPITETQQQFITVCRQHIANVISGKDKRLMVVCGPCSIHELSAAMAYAQKLKGLAESMQDRLLLVMRVYFEKPRSSVGWKGMINDPDMDGSYRIEKGLFQARTLLSKLADMQLPVATEVLDPISPQYLSDLISWAAIGARTTESQTHRELASCLQLPVGFKNGTDGSITAAINAMKTAAHEHRFLGIDQQGKAAILHSKGNLDGHVILRGGGGKPNYDAKNVAHISQQLTKNGLNPRLMIDCSHGNSNKDPNRQPLVARDILRQIQSGNRNIMGVMLESHLNAGAQTLDDPKRLKYGVSITDACLGWTETAALLEELYTRLPATQ